MGDSYYRMFAGDYAADTGDLSLAEHGAYLLLMNHYYMKGRPAADRVYRICRALTDEERTAVDRVVDQYFTEVDGELINDRCEEERADRQAYLYEQARKSKLGVAAKKKKKKTPKDPNDNPPGKPAGHPTDAPTGVPKGEPLPSPSPSPSLSPSLSEANTGDPNSKNNDPTFSDKKSPHPPTDEEKLREETQELVEQVINTYGLKIQATLNKLSGIAARHLNNANRPAAQKALWWTFKRMLQEKEEGEDHAPQYWEGCFKSEMQNINGRSVEDEHQRKKGMEDAGAIFGPLLKAAQKKAGASL